MTRESFLIATSPLDFCRLLKLVVVLKGNASATDCRIDYSGLCRKPFQSRIMDACSIIRNMLKCHPVCVIPGPGGVIDVICEKQNKKAVKKLLKKEKKRLQIYINKKAEEGVHSELLRQVILKCLECVLLQRGWTTIGNGGFVGCNVANAVDGITTDMITLEVQLEGNNKIVLRVVPDIVKWRLFKISQDTEKAMKQVIEDSAKDLEEWLAIQSEEAVHQLRCRVVPSLAEGVIVGFCTGITEGVTTEELQNAWYSQTGMVVPKETKWVYVMLFSDCECSKMIFPTCCVITASGLLPVPLSVRAQKMPGLMERLTSDLKFWNVFGSGNIKFNESPEKTGCPAILSEAANWTSVSAMWKSQAHASKNEQNSISKISDEQANEELFLNLTRAVNLGPARREKPEWIALPPSSTIEPEEVSLAEKTKYRPIEIQVSPSRHTLIVPQFVRRSGSSTQAGEVKYTISKPPMTLQEGFKGLSKTVNKTRTASMVPSFAARKKEGSQSCSVSPTNSSSLGQLQHSGKGGAQTAVNTNQASIIPTFAARKKECSSKVPSVKSDTKATLEKDKTTDKDVPQAATNASKASIVPSFAARKKDKMSNTYSATSRTVNSASVQKQARIRPPKNATNVGDGLNSQKKRKDSGEKTDKVNRSKQSDGPEKKKKKVNTGLSLQKTAISKPESGPLPAIPEEEPSDLVEEPQIPNIKASESVSTAPKEKTSSAPPRKRTNADDFDVNENTNTVRNKFLEGKSADLCVPRLKNFITAHKLGKVSGRKEELLARIADFLSK